MVPQVENAEEARLAVRYAKYPPQGSRVVSPTWTFYMDVAFSDYLPVANEETCVIVQVESVEAMKNLESIAEVEGVDIVFAGPFDLAASLGLMGYPEHPAVQDLLEQIPRRVARVGKSSGISVLGPDPAKNAYAQGYRFINIGHILLHGTLGLTAGLKQLREMVSRPPMAGAT